VEILNLGGAAEENSAAPKSRKKFRVILGIGALAAVTGIGSTLAANISLNGGGNVEFGQGVATTAACDDDITLTPISEFSNTEEDATFAMTAIQVSNIDLTPEGWDFSEDDWAAGYTPGYWDNENGEQVDGSWDPDYAEFSGQYKASNGSWIKTCANKSLLIHAYTDTDGFYYATDGNDVSTPLMLTGVDGHRPDNRLSNHGYNRGVGYKFFTYRDGGYEWDHYMLVEDNRNYSNGATYNGTDWDITRDGSGDTWDDSTFTLYFGYDSNYPPVDSQMVDKLTIESSATIPNGWYWGD